MYNILLITFAVAALLSIVSGRVTPVPIKGFINSFGGYQLTGAANSSAGSVVSMIGDYNKDGKQDFAISSPSMTLNSKAECGMVLIVLGNMTATSEIDLSSVTSGLTMRRVVGAAVGDKAGSSLGPAGDVNDDGFDDLLIGAPFADPSSRANAGAIYVIFGMASTTAYDDIILSSFTAGAFNGFTIFGPSAGTKLGEGTLAMRPLGDMNGDNIDDFLISAPSLRYSGRANAGGVWIIYGTATAPINLDLNSLGTAGILFGGSSAGEKFGNAMDCAGDFNGDGTNDIVIGAFKYGGTGHVYLVHGSTTLASQSMTTFYTGSAGFRFIAAAEGDDAGFSVCGAGDINGDGREDVLIGAPGADKSKGRIYVVFGMATSRVSNLFLANPMAATVGFTLAGMSASKSTGVALSRAGDLDRDGFNEFIFADNSAVYIIYGNSVFPSPFLNLHTYSFTDKLFGFSSIASSSLCGGFDISGDNNPDIIVGSPSFIASEGSVSGAAYLVEGPIFPLTIPPTLMPTHKPTTKPTAPTCSPTQRPTLNPSCQPTLTPSRLPTLSPSFSPSFDPTIKPSAHPTATPSAVPSMSPIPNPSTQPTVLLVNMPTEGPSAELAPTVLSEVILAVEQVPVLVFWGVSCICVQSILTPTIFNFFRTYSI